MLAACDFVMQERLTSMKQKMIRLVARIIPLTLIILILISSLTGFRAEMLDISVSADLRSVDSSENNPIELSSYSTLQKTNDIVILSSFSTLPGRHHSPYINPLTGLGVINDISRNRPVAVSISNQRAALPTNAINGISQADIVYEVLVEGGITRFVGIYQDFSEVGVVGSIRSARHYIVELAEAYDAMFIHAGGSPRGFEEVDERGITNFDGVTGRRGQIFRRDVNRIPGHTVESYHGLITSGASFTHWLPSFDLRLTHNANFNQALKFTDNPVTRGMGAHNVTVRFSAGKSSIFNYNAMQDLYYMSQYGSVLTDVNNGEPVTFTNLLILKTPVSDLVGHGEGAGRQDMSTVGSGTGYFVSGGGVIGINWFRACKASQFIYTLENGTELELGRGKTYIGIIPVESNASFN